MMSFQGKAAALLLCASLQAAAAALPLSAQSREQRAEEAYDYYQKWLQEDVAYIITPEEREVFLKLTVPEERDQFIEQFWRRRDPDPSTAQNEVKEEHYRRIAYANEHFHSGVPGWRTDRGMIYIKFGPPQGIEKQPEGGFYARKGREGGGFTSTHPFEVWFYNNLPGVGEGIEIEFVDANRTNEYRIARDPDEKDALLHVPGAGLTAAEAFGSQSRLDRLRLRGLGDLDSGGRYSIDRTFQSLRARDFPLQRLETLYKLQRAPGNEFKDLQKIVDVRLSYSDFPFQVRIDHLQMSEDLALVPVTLFFRGHDLTYRQNESGVEQALVELYGRLETLQGRIQYSFEDTVRHLRPTGSRGGVPEQAVFQKRFPLSPGRYKLTVVAEDAHSERIGTAERLIVVENRDRSEGLFCSSVILTKAVDPIGEDGSPGDPFVLTRYKVRPIERHDFSLDDRYVQSYFEVYNLAIDASTLAASAQVEIALDYHDPASSEAREVFSYTPIDSEFEFDGNRLLIYKTIPFEGLIEGGYTVRFRVTDQVGGASIENSVDFNILPQESAG